MHNESPGPPQQNWELADLTAPSIEPLSIQTARMETFHPPLILVIKKLSNISCASGWI